MRNSPYPEYQTTEAGVAYPKYWAPERLRFRIVSNPVKSEVNDWEEDELVSFVPMEAVGEYGGINTAQEKLIGDVYGGYTYFADGDVLIAKITPCFENGKGAIAGGLKNGVGFGTTEFHVLRPIEPLSKRWLFYVTVSDTFRKIGGAEMLGAGGQKRVPEGFVKNFRVGIPSQDEQERIADFLDWKTGQIDALIAKKQQLIEKLQEQRIAVITQAVTKGLNPDAPMRDSGILWLGEVPGHWEVKRLKFDVSKVGSGVTPKGGAESYEQSGIPLLRSQNVHFESLRMDDVVYISEETHESMGNSQVSAGDVLINITGASIGRCNYADEKLGEANVNQHVCIVRPEESLLTRFLHYVLWSEVGQLQIRLEQSGSGREGLNFVALKNFTTPLPTTDEQQQIVDHVDKALRKVGLLISKADEAVAYLTEYRTALITAATTGKIDVREIKIPKVV